VDPQARLTSRVFRSGGRLVAAAHPFWHHRISGQLPPDASYGYVIVSNHESHADSILISHLPFHARWLAKEEIMKIPFLGWMMGWSGDVKVKRGNKDSGREALDSMAEYLRHGGSVMLFPEGTRSTTGEIGPFKDGAFKLAIETQRPVLPMVLTGCGAALPKGGWELGGQTYGRLHVLDPVETVGLTLEDLPALRDKVRLLMVDARHRLLAEPQQAA